MALPGAWFQDMGNSLMRYGMGQYEAQQQRAQQDAADAQARTAMQGVFSGLGELAPDDRPGAFLQALMLARPGTADRFGGQYAAAITERNRAVEQRRHVAQYQLDMGNALDAMGALPEAERPAFLMQQAARIGPEYADKLLAFTHLQQQQSGMTQAQLAAKDLENLKAKNDMGLLDARTQAARQEAARSAARAGGGGGGAAGAPGAVVPAFGVKPNQVVIQNQEGRQEVIYPQGSPEHMQAQDNVTAALNAEARIQELRAMMDDYGTETLPTKAKGRMANLYGAIVADIAKARGMGVLQAGEVERIEAGFPNPADSWSASNMLGIESSTRGALDQLELEAKRLKARNAAMYRNWPGLKTDVPVPEGMRPFRPSKARKVEPQGKF